MPESKGEIIVDNGRLESFDLKCSKQLKAEDSLADPFWGHLKLTAK